MQNLNYIQLMNETTKNRLKKFLPLTILLLIILSLTVWFFWSRRVTEEQRVVYGKHIDQANKAFEEKKYSEAVKEYYSALQTIPSEYDAYEGIITVLLLKNRSNDAQDILNTSGGSLKVGNRSKLQLLIGNYYYQNKQYEKAKEAYQKGLGLGVDNEHIDLMLGKTYLNLGNINDARKQLEIAGYKDDSLSEANLLRSYIYILTDKNKAKTSIDSVNPTDRFKAYYEEFRNVLNSLDDDKKFNCTKLGRMYINNGYPHLAIEAISHMEADLAEYVDALYYLGRAYVESGQADKGIQTLNNALSLGGLEGQIYWSIARAYVLKHDLDGAIKAYSGAISSFGKNLPEDLVAEYVDMLMKNKQYLKATESITDILTRVKSTGIYMLGIRSNNEIKEYAKIGYYLGEIEKNTLTDKEKSEFLYWKIYVLLAKKENEEVPLLLEKLLEIDKYNPKYYLLLGKYSLIKGDKELAKEALEKSIEYDVDNTVTDEVSKQLSNIK